MALANTKRTEVLPLVLSPSHQPTASPLWSLAFAKPAVPSGVYNLPLLCESAMSECAVAMAAAAGAESTVAALTDIELYSQSQTRAGAPLAASQVHELTLRRDESDSSAAGLPFQAAAWFNRPEYADLELHVAAQHDSVSSTFFLHRMWLQLEGGPEAVPPLLARCTQPQLAMHIIRVTGAAADVWHQALTFVYTGQCIVSGRQLPELLAIAAALNHRALGAAAERVAGDALSESRAVALVVDSCSCSAPVAVAAAQPAAVPASPVGSDADLPEAFAPPSSKRSPPAADVAQMVVRGAAQPLETAATAETRQYAADEAPPAKKDRHNHVQEPAPASEHDDDDEDQQWLAAATQRHSSSDAGHASGSAIPATIMKQSAGGSAAAAILVDDSGASDTGPSQSALEPAASLSISATFDQMAAAEEEDEEANKAEAEEDSELPSVWGRNMLAAPDMQPPASPSLRGSPTDTAADDEAVTDTTVVAAVSGEEPDSPPVVFQVYGDPLAGGRPSSAKVPVRPAALSGQRDALPLQLSGAEPAAAASLAASQSDAWRPVLPHAPDAAQVAAMVSALRSDEQLYGLILELQPVPLSAIQAVLTRTGLTCSRHTLVAFCDEQGISWSTADSDKRPRIKSKKSTKNHVGD